MPRGRGKQKSFTRAASRVLAEQVPAVLWTTDLEFKVTSCAGAALSALAVPRTVKGRPVACLFPQSPDGEAIDAHFLAAAGETCSFDVEVRGRDLHARVEPLRNENGEIAGVAGVAIDNTERQVAQRALRISERNYRSLIEEAPHAICRCTRSGSLLQVNRAMQEMLGHAESDLLIRNLKNEIFANPADYSEFLEKLIGHGSSQGYETRWVQQSGHSIAVTLSGRAVCDAKGSILYLDLFAENINERKQLEEQLRQAQKMQAVGQLAGGIAHDFNNLLTVIRGQAELMAEYLADTDPAYSRLEEIQRAAERASALTRQLLAFSRRQVLQARVLDLNSVVANMNQMLARLIGKNIELSFSPDPDLWPVKVDLGQIERVLMNLAVNARDAMPGGGKLTIETHNVREEALHGLEPGEYVQLRVADSGHGMDEATKARIFEPFFTTKQTGKGTGLGLSVVYGAVKQSGGQVRVESEPGAGTEFFIYLPHREQAAQDEVATRSDELPRGAETIVLVEDDGPIRHMVRDFLRNQGYTVLTAIDGHEALALIQDSQRIDLLISDLMMPRMSGRELTETARRLRPGIRVLLMSGNSEDSQNSAEGLHFLQKPFSIHGLAMTVRKALDARKGTCAAAAGSR